MLKNLKNKKKKRGFTLIELIIVIAIIAILAVIAIPKFGDVKTKANLKTDIANAKTLANAASTLLAEETIKPAATDTIYVIFKETPTDNVNSIEKYLQSTPEPNSASFTSYKVKVSKEGNVTVYVDTDSNMTLSGAEREVYPTVPDSL